MTVRRKPKAQWGHRPPRLRPEDTAPLPDDFLVEMASLAGVPSADRENPQFVRMSTELGDIAVGWAVQLYMDDTEVSEPDRRAALEQLAPLGMQLLTLLDECDLSTRRDIFSVYPQNLLEVENQVKVCLNVTPNGGRSAFLRDVEAFRRLVGGIANALGEAKRNPGGRNPIRGHAATVDLMFLWSELTGKDFTFSSSGSVHGGNLHKTGNGLSFVERALRQVNPALSEENIVTLLRKAYASFRKVRS